MAGNQEATPAWWDEQRDGFEIFVSEVVIFEASAGDEEAAKRRSEVLRDFPALDITGATRTLAVDLMVNVPLPAKAQLDALHVAVASMNAMDYLLTWNCRHIANASFRHPIESICRAAGFEPPIICTPLELLEE